MSFLSELFSKNDEDIAREKARKARRRNQQKGYDWNDFDDEYEDNNPFADPADVDGEEPEVTLFNDQSEGLFGAGDAQKASSKARFVEQLLRKYVEDLSFVYIATWYDADGKFCKMAYDYDKFHGLVARQAPKEGKTSEQYINGKRNEVVKLPDGGETRALVFEPVVVGNGQYQLLEDFFGQEVTKDLKKAYYGMLEVLRNLRKPQQSQPQSTASFDAMAYVVSNDTTAGRIAALEKLQKRGVDPKHCNLDVNKLIQDAGKIGEDDEDQMFDELKKLGLAP